MGPGVAMCPPIVTPADAWGALFGPACSGGCCDRPGGPPPAGRRKSFGKADDGQRRAERGGSRTDPGPIPLRKAVHRG